ncbi:MAG: PASTA domain-containing protein [Gemmatimonadales bacterium]
MKVRRRFSAQSTRQASKKPIASSDHGPLATKKNVVMGSGVLAASVVAGYLYAAIFLFPAPFIVRTSRVPAVLGSDVGRAIETLTDAGFVPEQSELVNHPSAPRNTVVWQDPPPEVAFPEGSTVRLTVSTGPARVEIPDVSGYTLDLARRVLQGAGLAIGIISRVPTPAPRGIVMNTRPTHGTFLDPGTEITVLVSEGAPTIPIPGLLGLTVDSAAVILEEAELQLGTRFLRTAAQTEPGTIVEQNPAEGTLSVAGTAINVWIARRGTN